LDGFWAAATAALVKSTTTLMLGICSVSQIVKSAYAWYVVGIRTVVVVHDVDVVGKTLKVLRKQSSRGGHMDGIS
jgi:hypothetical protein